MITPCSAESFSIQRTLYSGTVVRAGPHFTEPSTSTRSHECALCITHDVSHHLLTVLTSVPLQRSSHLFEGGHGRVPRPCESRGRVCPARAHCGGVMPHPGGHVWVDQRRLSEA